MVTIKSDTDSEPVQVEIFPSRFLSPETTQKLLNELYKSGGIVRMMIQGPNLPRMVTYGPGKGLPIEEHRNLLVEVGGEILSSGSRSAGFDWSWRARSSFLESRQRVSERCHSASR